MQRLVLGLMIWLVGVSFRVRAAEMVIQRGHAEECTGVSLTADGRYLASSAGGEPVKLWQTERGELIRDLPDSRDELPLAWSPDGKLLLTTARDVAYARSRATASVRMRAMPSGVVVRNWPDATTPLFFNGSIIRATDGKVLRSWRVADGRLLATQRLEMPSVEGLLEAKDNARYFAFSRNGKYLVFGGFSGVYTARVWDAVTGRLLHEVHANKQAFGLAAISDDGHYLVTQGDNPNWSPPEGAATQSAYARLFQLHLWDLNTRHIVATWPGYDAFVDGVLFLRFSRDGKRVFSGGYNGARICDVSSGKVLRQVEAWGVQDVSADDRLWASGFQFDLKIVSGATGKIVRAMPGAMWGGSSLHWSAGGGYLAGGPYLRVWNLRQAALLRTPNPAGDYVKDYANEAWWQNETTLAIEYARSASLWKLDATGKSFNLQKRIVPNFAPPTVGYSGYSNDVYLSPDGKLLLTNAEDSNEYGTLYLWRGDGKQLIRKIEIRSPGEAMYLSPILWLPDSTRFLTSTRRGLEIWNAPAGTCEQVIEPLPNWKRPTEKLQDFAISLSTVSPDGKYVVGTPAIGAPKECAIWNIEGTNIHKPRLARTLAARNNADLADFASYIASFSPDDEQLVLGRGIWHWRTNVKLHISLPVTIYSRNEYSPSASGQRQFTPAWSPDGTRLAVPISVALPTSETVATIQAVQIVEVKTGRRLANLATGGDEELDPNDWLIWTDDGYFSAPNAASKRVRWREHGILLPFNSPRDRALRRRFYQPARLGDILSSHAASVHARHRTRATKSWR